ncbi:MAG: SMI1/KNR4 family protein [Pirellulales bacterium]|jgi:hypothetical protein
MTHLSDAIQRMSGECTVTLGGLPEVCDQVKQALGHNLPDELVEFYARWKSITGEYELSVIWPAERVIEENQYFRQSKDFGTLYMPFDCCLFFSDAGNGDRFFVPVYKDGSASTQIYVWNHETDERIWIAGSVHQFIEGWVSGKIMV